MENIKIIIQGADSHKITNVYQFHPTNKAICFQVVHAIMDNLQTLQIKAEKEGS